MCCSFSFGKRSFPSACALGMSRMSPFLMFFVHMQVPLVSCLRRVGLHSNLSESLR